MQLPSVERTPTLRPAGAEAAPPAAKVIPVAPVNPPVKAEPSPSVVNDINPALRNRSAREGEAAQLPMPDPLKGGAEVDTSHRNWTQRQPAPPEKTPGEMKAEITDILMEHMQALWDASKRAVAVWVMHNPSQEQSPVQHQQQVQTRNQDPAAIPGMLAKDALTYTPSKIKKPENI